MASNDEIAAIAMQIVSSSSTIYDVLTLNQIVMIERELLLIDNQPELLEPELVAALPVLRTFIAHWRAYHTLLTGAQS